VQQENSLLLKCKSARQGNLCKDAADQHKTNHHGKTQRQWQQASDVIVCLMG